MNETERAAIEVKMRAEVTRSIERGRLAEPFSATIFGSALLAQLVGGFAISAVASIGDTPLTRLLHEKGRGDAAV